MYINKWNKIITFIYNVQKSPKKINFLLIVEIVFSDGLENKIDEIEFLVKFYLEFCSIFKSERTNVMLFAYFSGKWVICTSF